MDFDPLQEFTWPIFACLAAMYTVIVFGSEVFAREKSGLFHKENRKALPKILEIHSVFVVVLLVLFRATSLVFGLAPSWMTAQFVYHGSYKSALDVLFVLVMLLMRFVERRRLYSNIDDA